MKIIYRVKGDERKSLVSAITMELNTPAKYLGAPTFAYQVGDYTIDKNGTLTGKDNPNLVADLQGLHDFVAKYLEFDAPLTKEESHSVIGEIESFEELALTREEELGLGKQRRDPIGEDGMQANDIQENDRLVIEVPLDGFNEDNLYNLRKLIASKASLIKKSIGAEFIEFEQTETTLRFPWFCLPLESEEIAAYTSFINALCTAAKTQKRVTATEKPVDNEKFTFRVFLIRIGFVGNDYKLARKILLRNLTGNTAFKNGRPENTDIGKEVQDE